MTPTLVIMAAGMASRYGSMKQIQQFGPGGETIIDYSIYDAIRAGFKKVVFIIRKDFAEDFKNIFDSKLGDRIEKEYVFQEMDAYLGDHSVPAARTKPWGTAHAVLCAQDAVSEPFAVINADDFYGKDAFTKAFNFLTNECSENKYALVGYELEKTLSENGSVSRGVCKVNENNELVEINERTNIYKEGDEIVYEEESGEKHPVDADAKASMNFWCFHPSVFKYSKEEFEKFLNQKIDEPKAEFLVPYVADQFIRSKKGTIKVLPTSAQWFGVTYKEDAPVVVKKLNDLIEQKEYPDKLWN